MKENQPRDPKKTPSLPPVLALARQQYNLCCYFVTSKPIINQYIRLISALDLRSLLFKKKEKRENKSVQRQLNQIRLVIFLICFLNDVINYEIQLMTKKKQLISAYIFMWPISFEDERSLQKIITRFWMIKNINQSSSCLIISNCYWDIRKFNDILQHARQYTASLLHLKQNRRRAIKLILFFLLS